MIFDPFLTLGYVEMIKVFLHPIDAVPYPLSIIAVGRVCPWIHMYVGVPNISADCTVQWRLQTGELSTARVRPNSRKPSGFSSLRCHVCGLCSLQLPPILTQSEDSVDRQ